MKIHSFLKLFPNRPLVLRYVDIDYRNRSEEDKDKRNWQWCASFDDGYTQHCYGDTPEQALESLAKQVAESIRTYARQAVEDARVREQNARDFEMRWEEARRGEGG